MTKMVWAVVAILCLCSGCAIDRFSVRLEVPDTGEKVVVEFSGSLP